MVTRLPTRYLEFWPFPGGGIQLSAARTVFVTGSRLTVSCLALGFRKPAFLRKMSVEWDKATLVTEESTPIFASTAFNLFC